MQVKAEGAVQGYVERRSREGKVYRSVDLLCEGQRSGGAALGIPEDQMPLIEVCKQAEGKQARARSKCGSSNRPDGCSSICLDWKS
jgi:hypothetical protein